jgi:hypothetical protein
MTKRSHGDGAIDTRGENNPAALPDQRAPFHQDLPWHFNGGSQGIARSGPFW